MRSYRIAFREWFGLRPAEADVLVLLYAAGESYLTTATLAERANLKGKIGWHISQLRQALEAEAIDTLPGHGYRLTDEGRAECRAALWTIGEELRTAS